MIKMFKIIICLVLLTLSYLDSKSQLVTKWEVVDSTRFQYKGYILSSDYRVLNAISGVNENDFVIIGKGDSTIYNENRDTIIRSYSIHEIRQYMNKGTQHTTIYFDTNHKSDHFYSISHTSENVIIVVGDSSNKYSLMIITTDKGKSWQRKTFDSNEAFTSLSMINDLVGCIYKYTNNKNLFLDSIYITKDCWKTFVRKPLGTGGYDLKCISPIHFTYLSPDWKNNKTSFIYSTDGGENWIKSVIPAYINCYSYVGNRTFIAIGAAYDYNIYKTEDDGHSWRKITDIKKRFVNDDPPSLFNVLYASISFCDSLNGFIFNFDRIASIYKTSDGGESWFQEANPFSEKYPVLDPNFYKVFELYYPNKNFGFGVSSDFYNIKTENKQILFPPHFYQIINYYYQPVDNVKISWTSISEAKKYRLKIAEKQVNYKISDKDFVKPKIDTTLSDTTIILNNLNYGTSYYCWIKASNDTLESDWTYAQELFQTLKWEKAIYPPQLLYPKPGTYVLSGQKITARWSDVVGADSYDIAMRSSQNMDYTILYDTLIKGTSYDIDSLEGQYYYQIMLRSRNQDTISDWQVAGFYSESPTDVYDYKTILKDNDLTLYPNPVSNFATIVFKTEGTKPVSIKLYNLLGVETVTLVNNALYNSGTHQLNFSVVELPDGFYLLQVSQGNHVNNINFIKTE